ncbi:MAG: hypothetical protein DHS20C17_00640 [Cyclobacteriaceae bacterium]|nr:MAG: hypothetical protein DHS20C17_00640 [Cyclobacteriaceae bacterium]
MDTSTSITQLIDLLGWLGTALYLIPYYLLVRGSWSYNSNKFHIWNIVASVLSVINAAYHGSIPVAASCGIWGAIAGYGMIKNKLSKHKINGNH